MQHPRTILPNGVRILTIPMPSFESATVMVLVGAGSRYETKNNNGISHFLEHMAFKGTKKRPSAMAISSLIDGIGGECNAFTGKETTGYYIKSSTVHVELSLDILSDMVQHSLLDEKEIGKERGVILEEINLYEDTPARRIGDVYERLLYGDTPLGWDTAGEKDIIKNIKRDDFTSYMSSLYSPSNITVVVAGGIESSKVVKLVEKYFGNMTPFKTKKYENIVEFQEKPRVFVKHKNTEQVHLALGVRTVPLNHPHRYPLTILSSILGGGMSSRLFHEIREKRGLGYYVRSSSDHYLDCGNFTTTAGIDPKRLQEAVKVIVDEYRKISNLKSQISNPEFNKAKEYVKGHFVLELEDSRDVASYYAHQELLERAIDNPEDSLLKIDKVVISDVEEVARKYLVDKHLNLAVIGNHTDETTFEKILG